MLGYTKFFLMKILDSSKDVLFEQKTIENNKFVNQANVYSLIKIDSEVRH